MGSTEKIAAFDVETPNWNNDRMSSIGLAVIENGIITETFSSLVDPETHFDSFNTMLTGIDGESVRGAPVFPEIWEKIAPIMTGSLIIAHNAPFDMRVLASCLAHYETDCQQYLRYACTVQMGRRCYPGLPDHKLSTMCRYRSIPLDHHKAESDALACAKLFLDYIEKGFDYRRYIRTYDLYNMRSFRL